MFANKRSFHIFASNRTGNRINYVKYAFDKRRLKERFRGILAAGLAAGSDDQHAALLVYSLGRVDFTEEQIREVVRELPLIIQEQVMSTYELLIEKGRKEGLEKGAEAKSFEFVRNLLAAGKFTVSEIANYATVSEDFVQKVRADLNRKKK